MSKVVKGIGKAVKGIGKAIKKVASSKIGKVLLAAATIYVGGAALGAWNSPFSSINGILAKGGGAGAEVLGASEAAATTAGTTATTQAAGGTINLGSLGAEAATTGTATQAAGGTLNLGSLGAETAAAGATTGGATTGTAITGGSALTGGSTVSTTGITGGFVNPLTTQAANKGIISRLMSGVEPLLSTASKHPIPTAMLLSAAGSAVSPDEIDMMKEQQKLALEQEERDRERRKKNLSVAGIDLGLKVSDKPLARTDGSQVFPNTGIVNRNREV